MYFKAFPVVIPPVYWQKYCFKSTDIDIIRGMHWLHFLSWVLLILGSIPDQIIWKNFLADWSTYLNEMTLWSALTLHDQVKTKTNFLKSRWNWTQGYAKLDCIFIIIFDLCLSHCGSKLIKLAEDVTGVASDQPKQDSVNYCRVNSTLKIIRSFHFLAKYWHLPVK